MPYTTQQANAARRKAAYLQMGSSLLAAGGLGAVGAGALARLQARRAGVAVLKTARMARKVSRGGMIASGIAGVGLLAAQKMRERALKKQLGYM